nr:uncharacterized protein LOC100182187 isoform X2 [Ciona intestinalis]|eukprot:XP_026693382.1 uncharacterized protein LOC100182187 isoform X2 [Ciona intestinalis]
MRNVSAAVALRSVIRAGGDAGISLRSTRTSEVSSFVKNCNLAENHVLKKELNIWHKDTRFELRKMNKQQDDMYRSLLKLSRAKKIIKKTRTDDRRDKEETMKWKKSKRRNERRNVVSVEEFPQSLENERNNLNECIDKLSVQENYQDFDTSSRFTRTHVPAVTSEWLEEPNQCVPLTVSNLNQFNLERDEIEDGETSEVFAKSNKSGSSQKNLQKQIDVTNSADIDISFKKSQQLNSTMTSQSEDDDVISAVALENEKPAIRRRQTIAGGLVEVVSQPLPGLSLKSIQVLPKEKLGRVQTVGKFPMLPRPPHAQRLKMTKFSSMSNVLAFNEDDEQSVASVVKTNLSISETDDIPTINQLIDLPGNMKVSDPLEIIRMADNDVTKQDDVSTDDVKVCQPKRKRRRKRRKLQVARKDPSVELNNRSAIEALDGKIYDVTVYKKDAEGNLEGDNMCWDTTIDVAKYFNLAKFSEKMKREKLLGDAKDKETQQRRRVSEFLKKLSIQEEATRQGNLARNRAAEEARLALEKRIEALKRGPPRYGTGENKGIPSYVRDYVRPSINSQRKQRNRKRSSWSIPSLFTLQACSNSKFGNSFNSSIRGCGGSPPGGFPDASSHLVNINVEKYLLEVSNT